MTEFLLTLMPLSFFVKGYTQEPESSSAMSRHQDSDEKYEEWSMKDQYKRMRHRLHSSFLKLDDPLRNRLLAIVGKL